LEVNQFISSLTRLEAVCREAVERLSAYGSENLGLYENHLVKLQQLYGLDGAGGYRQEICSLIGDVGHCLNSKPERRPYCINVVKDFRTDNDGEIHWLDGPYIEGQLPFEFEAEESASALLFLIDRSKQNLMQMIGKVSGGNLEWLMSEECGKPLIENAWERLGNHWGKVMEGCQELNGLDLYGFCEDIHNEIKIAKCSLTESLQFRPYQGIWPAWTGFVPRNHADNDAAQRVSPLNQIVDDQIVDDQNITPEQTPDDNEHRQSFTSRTPVREKKGKKVTVDQRMKLLLIEKPESSGWTVTKFQKELKCSRGAVGGAPTWQMLESARKLGKNERAKDRHRNRK
jgi:hypothetical protein